jgi:phosphatidylglycerol:prolipoprotein diacylglycerol transferase
MFPVIHIAGLELSAWRVSVLTGVVLCWILFCIRARRQGYSFYAVFFLLLLGLPVGTLGGHLFNKAIPTIVGLDTASYPLSGLTVIGSIVFCLLFSFFYIKHVMKAQPTQFLDAVAFTFPLSILVGRMGCLLAGCCYGKLAPEWIRTSFLSIFTLPADFYVQPSHAWHDYAGLPPDSLIWNLPLFLMINAFLALVVTEIIYRKREKWNLYPGTVIASTCTLYASGRFLIEFIRKAEMIGDTILNPWQLTILLFSFISLFWFSLSLYRRTQHLSPQLSG